MAEAMQPGSVIVDIAAERGGNCELTQAGETVVHRGISIVGPVNLRFARALPCQPDVCHQCGQSSEADGRIKKALSGSTRTMKIIRETLVTHEGKVVNPRVGQLLEAGVASA